MDISKWFYRPHYTTPELDKKIEDVEKALGFKLFIWQKTYIEYGVFRQYGETTAKILRLLITPGKIVDFTERPRGDRERFFRKELLEVKAKLNAAGVQTNEVYTNKKDLYRAMNERSSRQQMKRKLKVNDFFCGCGGMGIAFKNAGYEIAGAWDFDKYAVESYRANVGDHVQKADIKELHQADIPQADVWAFGFPCQDLSVAGKQRGMILKCEDCGEEIEINPEEYTGNTICPKCSSNNFKAASRSGCFFEMMRLLEETEREREHAMPAVIIAENVRGLRPYLPVLRLEYERHGYTAHIEMFNSKYWNVPQNRDRYAVVGTRNKKNLSFTFPKEQHEFVPKLSDYLEKDVPEKYYLPDEKAQTIIAQAMEKLEKMGKCHACITPDRINKRQNGPRAKAEDEPMFTLTAQDLHGVIILEDEQTEESVVTDIAEETGLLDPNGCGKTLRVGGGRKHHKEA